MKRSGRTRLSILDAAEHLFSAYGPGATSMRQITGLAEVNLSAVNYHFGSKEQLVQEVLQRRLHALNQERLSLLDALKHQAQGTGLKASQVVHAFFSPLIRHAYDVDQKKRTLLPLLEQSKADTGTFIRMLCTDEQTGVFDIFKQALLQALPGVPEEEIVWRFHFMLGATFYALQGTEALRQALGLPPSKVSATQPLLEARLLSFILGGLRAPLPDTPPTP